MAVRLHATWWAAHTSSAGLLLVFFKKNFFFFHLNTSSSQVAFNKWPRILQTEGTKQICVGYVREKQEKKAITAAITLYIYNFYHHTFIYIKSYTWGKYIYCLN